MANSLNFNATGLSADDDIRTAFTIPGATFEAVRDQRFFVHYKNQLDGDLIFPNDPTIMGATVNNAPVPTAPFKPFPPGYKDFQSPIPTVPHLHGVTPSASDGFPESWFTMNELIKGPAFVSSIFKYYNAQLATTLCYHDHTLGMTRLLVAAGAADRKCLEYVARRYRFLLDRRTPEWDRCKCKDSHRGYGL